MTGGWRGITFLFTDMEGSTRHWEATPEAMRTAMERHDALLSEKISALGGRVVLERGEGDSFFAVFDQPADAVTAAYATQRALAAETWPGDIPVLVRMAIHTGDADAHYRGPDVNRCARLRAIAWGGQVVVSAAVEELTRGALPEKVSLVDLGRHRLRDLTVPEQVFQLSHPELRSEFPALRSLGSFRHALPVQPTSFIGREREIAAVKAHVPEHPLVTLVGAGGCGKTRLALQVAAELLDDFADGCWFVDLAALSDAGFAALAVAQTLQVSETPGRSVTEAVADHLAPRQLLLVLDNCEHVIEAAAALAATLLQAAPGLRVVGTSREPLGVPGELVWRVPSLDVPDPERSSPEALLAAEAVRLFTERAASARPGFALAGGEAAVVARICARLDGIPLAIELAAARARILSLADILTRLNDRFRL
ncbi:MAG: ATP-binding protein, partial [Acidimicrobiia bacterium]